MPRFSANFVNLFAAIDAAGYDGWIGCEYHLQGNTEEGLGWRRPYLPPAHRSRPETPGAVNP